jgi:hypothetical protein
MKTMEHRHPGNTETGLPIARLPAVFLLKEFSGLRVRNNVAQSLHCTVIITLACAILLCK